MISFMVLAGPRSATAWLANLLTTDNTLCMHDPLLEHTSIMLDQMSVPGKRLGISDTSALLWRDWVNAHPAKKVILWRDPVEINQSLLQLGLPEVDSRLHSARINGIKGARLYHWEEVFLPHVAKGICDYFDVPFCRWRFEEMRKMNVQPQFNRLPIGKEAVRELVQRIAKEVA